MSAWSTQADGHAIKLAQVGAQQKERVTAMPSARHPSRHLPNFKLARSALLTVHTIHDRPNPPPTPLGVHNMLACTRQALRLAPTSERPPRRPDAWAPPRSA